MTNWLDVLANEPELRHHKTANFELTFTSFAVLFFIILKI